VSSFVNRSQLFASEDFSISFFPTAPGSVVGVSFFVDQFYDP